MGKTLLLNCVHRYGTWEAYGEALEVVNKGTKVQVGGGGRKEVSSVTLGRVRNGQLGYEWVHGEWKTTPHGWEKWQFDPARGTGTCHGSKMNRKGGE
jgi:hypothetical protein